MNVRPRDHDIFHDRNIFTIRCFRSCELDTLDELPFTPPSFRANYGLVRARLPHGVCTRADRVTGAGSSVVGCTVVDEDAVSIPLATDSSTAEEVDLIRAENQETPLFAWKPHIIGPWCIMVTFGGLLFRSRNIITSQRTWFREAKTQKECVLYETLFSTPPFPSSRLSLQNREVVGVLTAPFLTVNMFEV